MAPGRPGAAHWPQVHCGSRQMSQVHASEGHVVHTPAHTLRLHETQQHAPDAEEVCWHELEDACMQARLTAHTQSGLPVLP